MDDNIFNIVTLQAILESQYNIKVDTAMNGMEAVDKFKLRLKGAGECSAC